MSGPEIPVPSTLGAAGLELWERITAEFDGSAAEFALVEAACVAYQRQVEAREVIAELGITIEGRYGRRVNPAATVERDAAASMARLLRQLKIELDVVAPLVARRGAKPGPKSRKRLRSVPDA